jgi:ABC-2 type transport system permease protein
MKSITIILRADVLEIWNGITRGKRRRIISSVFALVFFLVFLGIIGVMGFQFAHFTRDAFAEYPALIYSIEFNMLSASAVAMFIMLFLTGIRAVYGNLFESGDLQFLMSTPLPIQSVFGAKFLKSFGTNFVSVFPLNGSLWIGYGIAIGVSPLFYMAILLILACVVALFTALTSLAVMVIMKFIPSYKMRQIIMIFSLLFALIGVFVGQYISIAMSGETQMDSVRLLESVGKWGFERVGYAPNVWVAKSVLLFVRGYSFTFAESLLPLIALSAVFIGVSLHISKYAFLGGWTQSKEVGGIKKLTTDKRIVADQKVFNGKNGIFFGMLRKDMRLLFRTPMMWYNFLASFVIMGFMIYRLSVQNESISAEEIPAVRVLILFMVLFLSASMSGFTSSFPVSLEGKSWWLMRCLPTNVIPFYFAKFFYAFIPSFLVSALIILALNFIPLIPTYPMYISVLTLIGVLSIQISIALVSDIWNPNFDMSIVQESMGGRRKTNGVKMLINTVPTVLIVLILAAVFSFPLYYESIGLTALTVKTAALISAILFILIIAVIDCVCFLLGCMRLKKLLIGYYD